MTMHRRAFVRAIAAAAMAGPAAACARSTAGSGPRRLRRVGIQLYALRDDARRDLERTLAGIAEIGYREIELLGSMNNFDMPPARLRAVLDRVGLRATSTHVSSSALDQLDAQLDVARTLGHEYLIIASIPAERRRTLDDWRAWADRFNTAGEIARRRDVWIGFHNHADDLRVIDGLVPYDLFVGRTDPRYVRHQLDTGNLAMAGLDPFVYLQRFRDRYWSFHIKDVPALGAKNDTELGRGMIDFRRLLQSVDRIDEKHLFVEQETYPGTPMESARRNFAYLSTLEF